MTDRVTFWVARIARIWPVHLVTLALAFLLLPFPALLGHASWPMTLPANMLLVQAWLPFKGSALSYNGVAWSLSVEVFFYLLFPWILAAMLRVGSLPLLAGSLALGLAAVLVVNGLMPQLTDFKSFSPVARLFEFVVGMSVCRIFLRRGQELKSTRWGTLWEMLAAVGVIALTLPVRSWLLELTGGASLVEWFITSFSSLGFGMLIWIFAQQTGLLSRWLGHPFLVLWGEISFSVYMCHQVLLRFIFFHIRPSGDQTLWVALIYFALTLALSYVLFRWVETPGRHQIIKTYRSWHARA
jgi:peptidoglycan/LPS O-acetylase OafA/YrhL